jgi:hypothetical protein
MDLLKFTTSSGSSYLLNSAQIEVVKETSPGSPSVNVLTTSGEWLRLDGISMEDFISRTRSAVGV